MIIKMKNIPKIELHVHLDGCLRAKTVKELLNSDIPLKEIETKLTVNKNCQDLNEYLEKFELPLQVLQTKENLKRVSYELGTDLINEHVIYAEIRFAPLLHLKKGLTIDEVVEAVIQGLNKSKLQYNLILCLMRGADKNLNYSTIKTAYTYLNKGVCALDLAGAESLYDNLLYVDLFKYAKKLGIPFTIHAGEASGKESIKTAIEMGAKRIGHGLNYEEDLEIINLLKENKIALEMCPTSNIQTKAITDFKNYPLYKLYKMGIMTTINTDNRTVSNTNLTKEYELLLNNFDLKIDDIIKMNEYAIDSAFLNNVDKEKLLIEYKKQLWNTAFFL